MFRMLRIINSGFMLAFYICLVSGCLEVMEQLINRNHPILGILVGIAGSILQYGVFQVSFWVDKKLREWR